MDEKGDITNLRVIKNEARRCVDGHCTCVCRWVWYLSSVNLKRVKLGSSGRYTQEREPKSARLV